LVKYSPRQSVIAAVGSTVAVSVAVGGRGVWVAVEVGGTGVEVGGEVGGPGVAVKVGVGGSALAVDVAPGLAVSVAVAVGLGDSAVVLAAVVVVGEVVHVGGRVAADGVRVGQVRSGPHADTIRSANKALRTSNNKRARVMVPPHDTVL
jgi:hypothetical protein